MGGEAKVVEGIKNVSDACVNMTVANFFRQKVHYPISGWPDSLFDRLQ